MPKKPATTREEIIEGAFQLIRKEGLSSFTVRRLAEELGCSTQPIMYQFPSLKELTDLAYERADLFHTEYITTSNDFMEIGLRYIEFASEETKLFHFLFQSGRFDGLNLFSMIQDNVDDSIILAAAKDMKMSKKEALDCFEVLFAIVHGYASLIANNALEYDEASLRRMLDLAAEGLMGKIDDTFMEDEL